MDEQLLEEKYIDFSGGSKNLILTAAPIAAYMTILGFVFNFQEVIAANVAVCTTIWAALIFRILYMHNIHLKRLLGGTWGSLMKNTDSGTSVLPIIFMLEITVFMMIYLTVKYLQTSVLNNILISEMAVFMLLIASVIFMGMTSGFVSVVHHICIISYLVAQTVNVFVAEIILQTTTVSSTYYLYLAIFNTVVLLMFLVLYFTNVALRGILYRVNPNLNYFAITLQIISFVLILVSIFTQGFRLDLVKKT